MTQRRKLSAEVAIAGGGIMGCASAYYLARRGVKVVLLEKSAIGAEASGHNSGGVRQQSRDARERPLAIASVKLWEGLDAELGFDTEYVQGGNIHLAVNEERMQALRQMAEEELAAGLPVEIWEREVLRRRAPYLGDVFVGAKYCRTDGVANPLIAARAFGWAARRAGALLLPRTEVVDIQVRFGAVTGLTGQDRDGEIIVEAPQVIHACGPWTPLLSRRIGIDLPLWSVRYVVAVTQRVQPFFTEFILGAVHGPRDEARYALGADGIDPEDLEQLGVRPARDGHIHIGGVATPDTFDDGASPRALHQLARRVIRMVPSLREVSFLHSWARLIQMTPDQVPIIGPVEGIRGYILAVGFSGHGFCLGPIVGKLLSELILDGEPSLSLNEFRLSRFAGTMPVEVSQDGSKEQL